MNQPLFQLGDIAITPGASLALAVEDAKHPILGTRERPRSTLGTILGRHVRGECDEQDEQDRQTKIIAIMLRDRIQSVYNLSDGTRIWIITESDRSVTTILLPEEY